MQENFARATQLVGHSVDDSIAVDQPLHIRHVRNDFLIGKSEKLGVKKT
jgi:hypothetical protein